MNSTLSEPEYVSETYLTLLITQYENEGYSVFVIKGSLLESEADMQAKLMPMPSAESMLPKKKAKVIKNETSFVGNEDDEFEQAMAFSMGIEYKKTSKDQSKNILDDLDEETRKAIEESMKEYDDTDKTLKSALNQSMIDIDGYYESNSYLVDRQERRESGEKTDAGGSMSSPTKAKAEPTLEEIRMKRLRMYEKKE